MSEKKGSDLSVTDQNLLKAIAQKEQREWDDFCRRFFEKYAPYIRKQAHVCSMPPSDIDDLVQTVMKELFSTIGTVFIHNGRKRAFRCYLRKLTASRIMDYWRKRQRRQEVDLSGLDEAENEFADVQAIESREDAERRDQARELIEFALAGIAKTTRIKADNIQAFQYVYLEDMDVDAVARHLEMKPHAVHSACHKVVSSFPRIAGVIHSVS